MSVVDTGTSLFAAPRADRRDRNRRRRWLTTVHRSGVSVGCRAWLLCLAERSDDRAKPVWGRQDKQAKEIGRCDRSVRTYRKEAEQAGLIECRRAPVVRESDGRVRRTATNLYVFCVPPGKPARKKSSSHRPETHCRSNQSLTGQKETLRRRTLFEHDPPAFSVPPPMGFDALRAAAQGRLTWR